MCPGYCVFLILLLWIMMPATRLDQNVCAVGVYVMHVRGAQTPRGSVQAEAEGVCNARTGWGDAKLNCSGVILEPSYKPGIRRFELTT